VKTLARFALLATTFGTVGLVACNSVLGWDEARIDPILDAAAIPDTNELSCESYCALVAANCSGDNLQYLTPGICLAMCVFDPGALTDEKTLSVGCRQHYAQLAKDNPATNCLKAGPLGGKQCGDACQAFCQIEKERCETAYASVAACRTACAKFAYDEKQQITRDQDQDTLNCRAYHLQAAFANVKAQKTHCPHTSEASDMCMPPPDAGAEAAGD